MHNNNVIQIESTCTINSLMFARVLFGEFYDHL